MDLSIVVPVHNEEKIVSYVIEGLLPYKKLENAEIIVVNDGSTDNTLDDLEQYKGSIKIITYETNLGYLEALRKGIIVASGEYILCIDGDRQYRPTSYLMSLRGELISGIKVRRQDPLYRVLISKFSNWLTRIIFSVPYDDMNCGFKIFHKELIPLFLGIKYIPLSPWGEFIIKAHYNGYNIKSIKIKHYKRRYGSSKLMRNMLKVCLSNCYGGIRLWLELFVRRK